MANTTVNTIDTEFFNIAEQNLTLVCAAFKGKTYWLLNNEDKKALEEDLFANIETPLLAYYSVAEARALLSMGLNPLQFKWIDAFAEFKMQQNCNNDFEYGNYINSEGKIKYSVRPMPHEDFSDDDDDIPKIPEDKSKVPSNLINYVYKNTGNIISSTQKEKMRDIIISGDINLINNHKQEIMDYCLGDTKYLEEAFNNMNAYFYKKGLRKFENDQLRRGRFSASMAIVETNGIPINNDMLNKVIEVTPALIEQSRDKTNEACAPYKIYEKAFVRPPKVYKNGNIFHYKETKAKKNLRQLQELITACGEAKWPKSAKTGQYQTKTSVMKEYRELHPALKAVIDTMELEKNLSRFSKDNKNGFFAKYGSDHRIRPNYGLFGTQTGRNAAQAKTFIPAMAKWCRALINPPKGSYLIYADFSQQEFALAAEISKDLAMKQAYLSGDVHLTFAKQAGAVPQNATKESHELEREKFKSTSLGELYGMGVNTLHNNLIKATKNKNFPFEEAQKLDSLHKSVYHQYWSTVRDIRNRYKNGMPLILQDGWTLWTDNPKPTSASNYPFQGAGACILREAAILLTEHQMTFNLFKVMFPLHDAFAFETDKPELVIPIINDLMTQACKNVLGKDSLDIRIDFKTIGHNEHWIEKKAEADWAAIKPHLGL